MSMSAARTKLTSQMPAVMALMADCVAKVLSKSCDNFLAEDDKRQKTNNKKTRQTRQDKTRQDKTRQDKTRQDKTRQDKTRQDKTRQDKTRQDKTRQDKPRSPIDMASGSLPKSPVSSSLCDEVPHIFIRKTHLQPREFLISSGKRLLQQYRHKADVAGCPLYGRCWGKSRHDADIVEPTRMSQTLIPPELQKVHSVNFDCRISQ